MAPHDVPPSPTVSPFLLAEPGPVSRRIEALGVPRPVCAGQHLYRQGEPSSSFHIVVSGRVRVHMLRPDGTVRVISWAEPGASLGEGVCFDGGLNQVSATAITPCELLAVGREARSPPPATTRSCSSRSSAGCPTSSGCCTCTCSSTAWPPANG